MKDQLIHELAELLKRSQTNENLQKAIDLIKKTGNENWLLLLSLLLDQEFFESQYDQINRLAGIYESEISAKSYGEKINIQVSSDQEFFSKFMYSWNFLDRREIPFEEWKDLAQEGIDILREMVQAGDLNYKKNPRYKLFKENYAKRFHQFIFDPRYSEQLQELLGD